MRDLTKKSKKINDIQEVKNIAELNMDTNSGFLQLLISATYK